MRVLTINCGSSSLKFEVIDTAVGDGALVRARRPARGSVDNIGDRAVITFTAASGERLAETAAVAGQEEAMRRVLDWLRATGLLGPSGPAAIGHRIVHGGDRFSEPVLIDDAVRAAIDALVELAPLHNGPALAAIRAAGAVLGPDVPMVATFDTLFHRTMPERAARYPIAAELAAKHHVRRYGFHGLAHRSMVEGYAALTATPVEQAKLITLQLGNGCSAAAIAGGRSVDTSMGFTPLEGLMMGTRAGDVDPSLAGFLARREGVTTATVEDWLNTRSGLLGVSGRSRDMRELLELERGGDARAALAVEMFCYRARKYIGAYLAALGGADAIVFGGGIGEHAAAVRARICAGMEWCGLTLDAERNGRTVGRARLISTDGAAPRAYVIPVDEAGIIARDTATCLRAAGQG